ncbi:MAG: hypothetical protein HOP18_08695 [Deltaproteobacteria bacterium]|nr:hypothetical protein [Deltaproteobacteria bacterium]
METILSLQEMQTRYDGEWVLIGDPETDEALSIQRGQVLWHSKSRDEVYRQARMLKPRHSAFLFIGRLPSDTEVVL